MSTEDDRANAGLLAATALVGAKQLPTLGNVPISTLPERFRPPSLADVSRLFGRYDQADETRINRISRLSAAAMVYSVDKKTDINAARILRGNERDWLNSFHEQRRGHLQNDRSCPHCRLLESCLYGRTPPIVIVNHGARVQIDFDLDTYVSRAGIKKYQALVPAHVAKRMFELYHPLHWADAPGSFFRSTDPVNEDGTPWDGKEGVWEEAARQRRAFMLESTAWPLNDNLSADSENILRITDFKKRDDSLYQLEYEYSLERCLRSNFGVAWEPSGLDLDGGKLMFRAVPITSEESIDAVVENDLCDLRMRDVMELRAKVEPQDDMFVLTNAWAKPGWPGGPISDDAAAPPAEIRRGFATGLSHLSRSPLSPPPYLITIDASKALHFTMPEYGPVELWNLLTWMAPTFLLTFLHRSITEAPHLLLNEELALTP